MRGRTGREYSQYAPCKAIFTGRIPVIRNKSDIMIKTFNSIRGSKQKRKEIYYHQESFKKLVTKCQSFYEHMGFKFKTTNSQGKKNKDKGNVLNI